MFNTFFNEICLQGDLCNYTTVSASYAWRFSGGFVKTFHGPNQKARNCKV